MLPLIVTYILYNKEKLNTYSTSLNAPVNDVSKKAIENEIKNLELHLKIFIPKLTLIIL